MAAMGRWAQFIVWIAVPSTTKPGKLEKLPVAWADGLGVDKHGRPIPAGTVVTAHDPAFWTTFDNVAASFARYDRRHGSGVGFVLTTADPFFCLDIDGALQPDGTWSQVARDLCATFNGAAVEVSQSGQGLHIFGCTTPVPHAKRNVQLGLELYTEKRFIALTGTHATGDVWLDFSPTFASVVASLFDPSKNVEFEDWTEAPCEGWAGPEGDDAVLERAMRHNPKVTADQAFSGRAAPPTFAQLWAADADALGAYWPHDIKPYDESSADVQLANLLAYFTGKNCEQMQRLMLRSGLVRDKWSEREEYLSTTIVQACRFVKAVLNEPPLAAKPKGPSLRPTMGVRDTLEYMTPADQLDHFDGCAYVDASKKVYVTKQGKELSKTSFDVAFGGYLFVIDPMGKKTTDSAFDAFTKSRVIQAPCVDDLCFLPLEEPGALVVRGNHVFVNAYVPHEPKTIAGDPAPFLDLLVKLLPDERDRAILLNYMACVVQNPGRKLQWWPVLQGAEGNGKSFLMKCLTYAIGDHYCHLPNAQAMARVGMQFNGWLHRKLFVGIEEVYVADRRSFLEEFKTVVTNDRVGMEPKGGEQSTKDNCANGMLCTNHPDGVPINTDNRRYAIFYTAQQTKDDVIRCGMGGTYFPELWAWAKDEGFAIIAHHLKTMPLQEDVSPLGAYSSRAPETTSTAKAVTESRGRIEQEIAEAIDAGRPGFAGGWVSSTYLTDLLARMHSQLSHTKRAEVLERMGYVKHPAFGDTGRSHRIVKPDGYRSVLWVRSGSLASQLTDVDTAASAYERAQTTASADLVFGEGPPVKPKELA